MPQTDNKTQKLNVLEEKGVDSNEVLQDLISHLRVEIRELQKQNDQLKTQLQGQGQVERDSTARLNDSMSAMLDALERSNTSTLQVIVNLADANANLRMQLQAANERIRNAQTTDDKPDLNYA